MAVTLSLLFPDEYDHCLRSVGNGAGVEVREEVGKYRRVLGDAVVWCLVGGSGILDITKQAAQSYC